MSESSESHAWVSRPVQGVLTIGALVLVLIVPIALIQDLVRERVRARDEAVEEVTSTWGGEQAVLGPRLVVPYRSSGDPEGATAEQGFVSFLPSELEVDGSVRAQSRSRGLFTIPVYEARLTLSGTFRAEELQVPRRGADELDWSEAALVIEVSDPKAIGSASRLSWDGRSVSLLAGAVGVGPGRRGVHAPVPVPESGVASFEALVDLRGVEALWMAPFAEITRVSMTSDWPDPSFAGAWLPDDRAVDGDGFTAEWEVPHLGRDFPQSWSTSADPYDRVLASLFGVRLASPVDHYRMSERSTKYAYLFLAMTFGLLWLFDTLVGVRVHPIQYLLIGAAMCMFYLLELSLSEHIGFVGAYGVAALAVVTLVAAYARSVLRSTARGTVMAGATGLLYAYLFALLTLERYALLVGSLGLFSALATVMQLTRNVDWHALSRAGDSTPAHAGSRAARGVGTNPPDRG